MGMTINKVSCLFWLEDFQESFGENIWEVWAKRAARAATAEREARKAPR
jgi:hypothetical protein